MEVGKMAATLLVLCCSLLTPNLVKAEKRRFREGQLSVYPPGTLVPNTANFVQSATPISTQKITGTLKAHLEEATGIVKFEVYYRNNSDTSTLQNSLIIQLAAPFRVDGTYQNQTVLYSDESPSVHFLLIKPDVKFYPVDNDFQTFKGEEIRNKANLLTLNLHLTATKQYTEDDEFSYKFTQFEIYFEKDSSLFRLVVNTETLDKGPIKPIFFLLFIVFVPAILLLAHAEFCMIMTFTLQEDKELGSLLFSSNFSLFLPITFFIIVKYFSGFWNVFLVGFVCFIFTSIGTMHIGHLFLAAFRKNQKSGMGTKCETVWCSMMLVTLFWFILLCFKFSLVLRTFPVYSVFLIIDWVICCRRKDDAPSKIACASRLAVLKGYMVQLIIYSFYFIFLYGYRNAFPAILFTHTVPDFALFVGLMSVTCFFGANGSGKINENQPINEPADQSRQSEMMS